MKALNLGAQRLVEAGFSDALAPSRTWSKVVEMGRERFLLTATTVDGTSWCCGASPIAGDETYPMVPLQSFEYLMELVRVARLVETSDSLWRQAKIERSRGGAR
jgi:hypothetical protein